MNMNETNMKAESKEGTDGTNGTKAEYRVLALGLLAASGTNPRKTFNEETMAELTESVKVHGVKQPLLVRPLADGVMFEVVAGERRLRAARLAGLTTVPCMVEALSDRAALEIQALENLQREDLSPLEEARGYAQLREGGMTLEEMQRRLGRKRSHIFAKLALLKLSPAAAAALEKGEISASVAELIGRIQGEKEQAAALKAVEGNMDWRSKEFAPMSFREAKYELAQRCMAELEAAAFDVEASYAGAIFAGPCAGCPHRSGNCREAYPEVASPDVCTLPACFHGKTTLHAAAAAARWREKGLEVLGEEEAGNLFRYGSMNSKQYALADARCHEDRKQRTMKEILGKDMPKPVMALYAGKAVKLYKKSELKAALAAKGIKPGEIRDGKEAKEEEADRAEYARRMLAVVVKALASAKSGDYRALIGLVVNKLDDSSEGNLEAGCKAMGRPWKGTKALLGQGAGEMLTAAVAGFCCDFAGKPDWEYMGPGAQITAALGLEKEAKRIEKEVQEERKKAEKTTDGTNGMDKNQAEAKARLKAAAARGWRAKSKAQGGGK